MSTKSAHKAGTHSRALRFLVSVVVAAGLSAGVALSATPAHAASQITAPSGFTCAAGGQLQVAPARIWASYKTEAVLWLNDVYRYNTATQKWYLYNSFRNYSSYNVFGQSVTYWMGDGTHPSGSYINSALVLKVQHSGYYRIASYLAGSQGGVTWSGWLANGGSCYIY